MLLFLKQFLVLLGSSYSLPHIATATVPTSHYSSAMEQSTTAGVDVVALILEQSTTAGVDVVELILAATACGPPHQWRGDLWQAAKYTLSSPLSCDNLLDACLPPVYTLLKIYKKLFFCTYKFLKEKSAHISYCRL